MSAIDEYQDRQYLQPSRQIDMNARFEDQRAFCGKYEIADVELKRGQKMLDHVNRAWQYIELNRPAWRSLH